jgi:biotin transport system substrate-specific component
MDPINEKTTPSDAANPAGEMTHPFGLFALRQIAFTAMFAALFVALSSVVLPIGPVPVTLQTFAVMIIGGLLGARFGFASILLVVALTAAGAPLLHGKGGISYVLGPTGGYIFAFPVAALLIGWAADRLLPRRNRTRPNFVRLLLLLAAMLAFGLAVPYLFGVPWLAYRNGMTLTEAIRVGCLPFVAGDTAKAVVATAVVAALRPFIPKLRPDR